MPAKILIVNQNPVLATQVSPVVQDLGYLSATCDCLESAIQAIEKRRPDLVLLDGDMVLQDPALAAKLRRCSPDVHLQTLLFIPPKHQDISRFFSRTEVDDFLCQPFSADELRARLIWRLPGQPKKPVASLAQVDFGFLAGLSNLAISGLGTNEILQRVIDGISQVIEIHRCSIAMVREDHEFGYVMASSDDPAVNGLRIDLERYPEIQETLRTGRPLVIDNIALHPVMERVRLYVEKLGFNSILVLPMVDRQRIIGVLVLRTARSAVGFTEEEVCFCQLVANVATSALCLAEIHRTEEQNNASVSARINEDRARKQRSSLLGMAAHDLRVLVSVIDGYCLLLCETNGSDLSKEQNDIVSGLMAGSRRLVDMANNLLDFSRMEAGRFEFKPEEQDICEIVASVSGEIVPLAQRRGIGFKVDCLDREVLVNCDEQGIRRVLYNILNNALKFTPDGGLIRLKLVVNPEEVRVSVEDNGPGIEPDFLADLFAEYHCTPSPGRHPGSGLGLSICKKILEAHQGRIWVESSLGQGSCFTFCLPKVP